VYPQLEAGATELSQAGWYPWWFGALQSCTAMCLWQPVNWLAVLLAAGSICRIADVVACLLSMHGQQLHPAAACSFLCMCAMHILSACTCSHCKRETARDQYCFLHPCAWTGMNCGVFDLQQRVVQWCADLYLQCCVVQCCVQSILSGVRARPGRLCTHALYVC
jgi:hypothetical protein